MKYDAHASRLKREYDIILCCPIFVGQLIAIALDSTSIDVFMMIWRCSYTTEEDDWMRIGCS
jgi:hypothetical protein